MGKLKHVGHLKKDNEINKNNLKSLELHFMRLICRLGLHVQ